MACFADLAFVIDDATCIGNHRIGYFRLCANHCARGNDEILTQNRTRRDRGGRVDHVDQIQLGFLDEPGIAGADAIIANRDDGAADLLLAKLEQEVDRTKHLDPANLSTDEVGIRIKKSADPVLVHRPEDIQDNFPMPAGANDDNVHAYVIGPTTREP